MEIESELKQLEQRIVNIDLRIKEDLEAEEIGIAVKLITIGTRGAQFLL